MILTYQTEFRTETDAEVIATLQRKGWTEARMDVQTAKAANDPRIVNGFPAGWPVREKPLAQGDVAEWEEMSAAGLAALKAAHQAQFNAYVEPPEPWRVSKDTLVGRIPTEVLPVVMAALAQQSPEQQFLFNQSAWFWSSNANLRGLAQALNLDADALMAPDPFLT